MKRKSTLIVAAVIAAVLAVAVLHGQEGFYRGEGFSIVEASLPGEAPREHSLYVCSYWSVFKGAHTIRYWPVGTDPVPVLPDVEVQPQVADGSCP